ncbi:MAG TPA: SRPBCC family protein [Lacunisphaera sp.]|nr:SRPBCC family protein [Lacunisphaera sp.]
MKSTNTPAAEGAIVSARRFDPAPARVFAAFANPAQLARWWGPDGFTTQIHEFDLRPGGAWRLTMRGPDGAKFVNLSHFLEVAAPNRVVYEHDDPVHRFRMTMTFAAEGTGTRLTWRMVFASAEEFARVRALVATANEQNFDRLAAHLVASR